MNSILIIGAPTIDDIDGRKIVGGPGLYGGLAASLLGCKVYVLGPLGSEDLSPLVIYKKLDINYLGPIKSGCSYTFRHEYSFIEKRRRSKIICKSSSLSVGDFKKLNNIDIDIILVSPVHCEISPDLIKWLYMQSSSKTFLVDLQGVIRCFKDRWITFFTLTGGIYHLSSDDTDKVPPLRGVTSYTHGLEGGWVFIGEDRILKLPKPSAIVLDPTGAGDVFFTLFACLYVKSKSLRSSFLKSAELTPLLLSKIKIKVFNISKEVL